MLFCITQPSEELSSSDVNVTMADGAPSIQQIQAARVKICAGPWKTLQERLSTGENPVRLRNYGGANAGIVDISKRHQLSVQVPGSLNVGLESGDIPVFRIYLLEIDENFIPRKTVCAVLGEENQQDVSGLDAAEALIREVLSTFE